MFFSPGDENIEVHVIVPSLQVKHTLFSGTSLQTILIWLKFLFPTCTFFTVFHLDLRLLDNHTFNPSATGMADLEVNNIQLLNYLLFWSLSDHHFITKEIVFYTSSKRTWLENYNTMHNVVLAKLFWYIKLVVNRLILFSQLQNTLPLETGRYTWC